MLANDPVVSESVRENFRPPAPEGSAEAVLSHSSAAAYPAADVVAAAGNAPGSGVEPGVAAGVGPGVDRQAALRALRNLEATEARLARAARQDAEAARGKLVQDLLPVLDNLDRTICAAQVGRSDPAMLEGVRLVRHQLDGVLRGYGAERVDALGQRFDPALHEAIGVTAVSDPERHGQVVHQAEPGYRFAGKLLRPAKVTVGKLVAPAAVGQHPLWR